MKYPINTMHVSHTSKSQKIAAFLAEVPVYLRNHHPSRKLLTSSKAPSLSPFATSSPTPNFQDSPGDINKYISPFPAEHTPAHAALETSKTRKKIRKYIKAGSVVSGKWGSLPSKDPLYPMKKRSKAKKYVVVLESMGNKE